MSLNHEKLKQRRAEDARGGAGWKVKEGENKVRVLPPHSRILANWDAMDDIAVPYNMHFFRIQGRPSPEVSRCLRDLNQACPACETFFAYRKSDDPGLRKLANDVGAARMYLMNMIDVNDLKSGVQHWAANYSCWDGVLEVAADPSYGNPLDPTNGINFIITLTPKSRSRTGFPQYDVQPERAGGPAGAVLRTSVTEILAAFPGWQAKLDALADQVTAAKEAAEIQTLVTAMGFPPVPGRKDGPARVLPSSSVAAPASAQSVTVPAGPTPGLVEVPSGPMVLTMPGASPPAATPRPVVPASAVAAVHYDPGPQYTPRIPDDQRPAGVPRCYGDYNPKVHQCQPCPVRTECQMRQLGIDR